MFVAKVVVVEVAPVRLLNVAPPFVLNCHCTPGGGDPLAAAAKVTGIPATIVWLIGLAVTVGATGGDVMVRNAARVVADPATLVNTARK